MISSEFFGDGSYSGNPCSRLRRWYWYIVQGGMRCQRSIVRKARKAEFCPLGHVPYYIPIADTNKPDAGAGEDEDDMSDRIASQSSCTRFTS